MKHKKSFITYKKESLKKKTKNKKEEPEYGKDEEIETSLTGGTGAKSLPVQGVGWSGGAGIKARVSSGQREGDQGRGWRPERGLRSGDSGLWIKTELNERQRGGRREGRGGGHLIRLVSVLLAVAVDSVTRRFLLLGQLGLGGQQGGEGEEAGGGGDGGEGRLAQAQRQRGHGQGQALELRQLVSLELLPYDGVHLWGGDLLGPLYGRQNLLLVLLRQVGQDLCADPVQSLHYLGLFVHLNIEPIGHLVVHDIMALHL